MLLYPSPELLAAWGVAIASILYGVFKVWRAGSNTKLASTKDEIEGAGLQLILNQLKKQNEELKQERDSYRQESRIAWEQRMSDLKRIAELESENIYLKQKIETIAAEVLELKNTIKGTI